MQRKGCKSTYSHGHAGTGTARYVHLRHFPVRSYDQQISAKGEKAVELLIRNINEPELTKQELILPVSLVERGSVRKIKTETT